MAKKVTSTLLLLITGVALLLYGLQTLIDTLKAPGDIQVEPLIFAVLYLGTALYAFISAILLPRKIE